MRLAIGESVGSGTLTWLVSYFPWDARFTGGFGIDDGALVSVGESFAESVEFINRGTFASANVIVEVTPASVFIEIGYGGGDVSGEGSKG